MQGAERIQVLVVEDQYYYAIGITECLRLESDMEVVGVATSEAEALEMSKHLAPDVVLLDMRLPTLCHEEFVKLLGEQSSGKARILVLSEFCHNGYVIGQDGVLGYAAKRCTGPELADAIRNLVYGKSTCTSS